MRNSTSVGADTGRKKFASAAIGELLTPVFFAFIFQDNNKQLQISISFVSDWKFNIQLLLLTSFELSNLILIQADY